MGTKKGQARKTARPAYEAKPENYRFFKWWDNFGKRWDSVIPGSQAKDWMWRMRMGGFRVEEKKRR